MGLIGWFAVQTEAAHDEARCPFEATGRVVELAGSGAGADAPRRVVEEARSCVRGIAEHRWRLSSGTEVGRRRLPVAAYDGDAGYTWDALRLDGGGIEVAVQPAGETKVFRLTLEPPSKRPLRTTRRTAQQ